MFSTKVIDSQLLIKCAVSEYNHLGLKKVLNIKQYLPILHTAFMIVTDVQVLKYIVSLLYHLLSPIDVQVNLTKTFSVQ